MLTSPLDSWCQWGIAHFCLHTLIFGIPSSVPRWMGFFLAVTMQEPVLCIPCCCFRSRGVAGRLGRNYLHSAEAAED